MEILDGKTGKILSRIHLPNELTVTIRPQLLRLKSGMDSIIFATEKSSGKGEAKQNKNPEGGGKETSVRPGLTILSLQDLFKGDVSGMRNIFEGTDLTEPLLVDLTHDKWDDIIFQARGFRAVTLDGASLLELWNVTDAETGRLPAISPPKIVPVFYDDDDSLDFVQVTGMVSDNSRKKIKHYKP